MEQEKISKLIKTLRKKQNLTQKELSDTLNISDKAVSKWERGLGIPDISIMPKLAEVFNVDLNSFLSGELDKNKICSGNLKNGAFYYCEDCKNILFSLSPLKVSCCGKTLKKLTPQKVTSDIDINIQVLSSELYITSSLPMEKNDYISFVALLNGDVLTLKKLYPESNMEVILPFIKKGTIYFYSTKNGLFYKNF